MNECLTREEVEQALGSLKKRSAAGSGGLTEELVCCNVLVDFWCSLFNWCWRYGMIPSEWRKSVTISIPKKRRRGVCKVYEFCGISLTLVVYKVVSNVVHRRLLHVVEEKQLVADEQGGFRKGRGCRDQLMTLVLLGQMKAVTGRGMFASFIDFRKAYDRVD